MPWKKECTNKGAYAHRNEEDVMKRLVFACLVASGFCRFLTDPAPAEAALPVVEMPAMTVAAAIPVMPLVEHGPAAVPVMPLVQMSPGYNAPIGSWAVRRASIDATAGSIYDELGVSGNCSVTIIPTASQVNFGGSDVDNSTKYASICTSGCDITAPISFDTNARSVFVRSTSGSVTAVFLLGNGC